MSTTEQVAEFNANTRFEQIPAEAINVAKALSSIVLGGHRGSQPEIGRIVAPWAKEMGGALLRLHRLEELPNLVEVMEILTFKGKSLTR